MRAQWRISSRSRVSPVNVSSSSFRVLSWQIGVSHLAVHSHINDAFTHFLPAELRFLPSSSVHFLFHTPSLHEVPLVIQALHFLPRSSCHFRLGSLYVRRNVGEIVDTKLETRVLLTRPSFTPLFQARFSITRNHHKARHNRHKRKIRILIRINTEELTLVVTESVQEKPQEG